MPVLGYLPDAMLKQPVLADHETTEVTYRVPQYRTGLNLAVSRVERFKLAEDFTV